MSLTVAYITNRRDCHIEWFLDSLRREFPDELPNIIVIDFFFDQRHFEECRADIPNAWQTIHAMAHRSQVDQTGKVKWSTVKPNVWCGAHRLTKENWFAASNFRSTAFCLCDTQWLAYVDDVSVIVPGWGDAVREAMAANRITCGTYQKVRNLVVENGEIKSFTEFPEGMDARPPYAKGVNPFVHSGEWLFGCSVLMPTQVLVEAGGWPEFVDGMGGEDYLLGKLLDNRGHTVYFDQRMKTLESDEHHFIEKPWIRSDYGVSPRDKSHKALELVNNGMKYFVNDYCGPGGIPELRRRVLAGEPFPIVQHPRHCWYTGTPLSELEPNHK